MLLAFFQNLLVVNQGSTNLFIKHNFKTLFADEIFKKLFTIFCQGNGIPQENSLSFFVECILLLEKNCLGSYKEENNEQLLEIRVDTEKIITIIDDMFISSTTEIGFMDIYTRVLQKSEGFYNSQYVKFILKIMVENYTLMFDSAKNVYSKML